MKGVIQIDHFHKLPEEILHSIDHTNFKHSIQNEESELSIN